MRIWKEVWIREVKEQEVREQEVWEQVVREQEVRERERGSCGSGSVQELECAPRLHGIRGARIGLDAPGDQHRSIITNPSPTSTVLRVYAPSTQSPQSSRNWTNLRTLEV
mmetsp:Transcript_27186/g.61444  ORF Transcript_27186/g.61444 Transcript_27186/m.61444 type:complete len:110 (-) Transcript_27186:288-617(-)